MGANKAVIIRFLISEDILRIKSIKEKLNLLINLFRKCLQHIFGVMINGLQEKI